MIAVAGEALIDLVVDHDGRIGAQPGGGPFNTARTIGRLGLAPTFLGRLSADSFGHMLRVRLDQDGVTLAVPQLVDAPTTLAAVEVGTDGAPRYRFYLDGTSATALEYPLASAALPPGLTALHAGSLALVMEPIATSIERLLARDVPPETLVMVDPNCRPEAVTDQPGYRSRLTRILRRADVVKVSMEDLAYLSPGVPSHAAAAALLGSGPALVLLTDGPRPARALMPGHEVSVEVPAVVVADTIGAGDAFGGAFLAWWHRNGFTRSALQQPGPVREALRAAVEVASVTCTRVGAEPPWLTEVSDRPGWRPGPGAPGPGGTSAREA
ncbi:MAG TPA: carbohydrate kinase [Streptosporangiaceae bacterium]|nr:carbohydrate kinase [Streptosporangiaceae bacterium]